MLQSVRTSSIPRAMPGVVAYSPIRDTIHSHGTGHSISTLHRRLKAFMGRAILVTHPPLHAHLCPRTRARGQHHWDFELAAERDCLKQHIDRFRGRYELLDTYQILEGREDATNDCVHYYSTHTKHGIREEKSQERFSRALYSVLSI